MSRRPRLLYLAYYFPPANAVASVRSWNSAIQLSRLGWDVSVLTPAPSLWRSSPSIAAIDEKLQAEGVRRIATGHRRRWLNPAYLKCAHPKLAYVAMRLMAKLNVTPESGWSAAARRAGAGLKPGDCDLILATGTPFGAFSLARELSQRLGCPYVLDYRDEWTAGNPHGYSFFRRNAAVKMERDILRDCRAAIAVSPALASIIGETFSVGGKMRVVTNGYDPEEMAGVRAHKFDHFAVVYTGIFYRPTRVITPVMAGLARLRQISQSPVADWRFHYYGPQNGHVAEEAARCGLSDRIVLHGKVPRAEALAAVKGAGAAVVVASVCSTGTLLDMGVITGKVFEPLGLGTPILGVAPHGSDLERLLEVTGQGRCCPGDDIDGIARCLSAIMNGSDLRPRNLDAYAWPNLARQVDAVLRRAMGNASPQTGDMAADDNF